MDQRYINTDFSRYTKLTVESNKRSGKDRRKLAIFNMRMLAGNGNRRIIRRQEDKGRLFFVDHYSPMLFVTIIAVLFLCVLDALLTLYLLNHGAYEINPIMEYLLNIGPYAFYIAKYALTIISAFGLLLLRGVVIQKFNITVQALLYFVAGIYLIVVVWELYLFSKAAS